MRTGLNRFGLLREYHHRPSYDPDMHVEISDLADYPEIDLPTQVPTSPPPPWPFGNMSKYLLMNWVHSGSERKSESEVTRLVNEVIQHPEFRQEDLAGFSAHRENRHLDDAQALPMNSPFSSDGWEEVSVMIDVPVPGSEKAASKPFTVPGLHRRPIIQVLKSAWSEMSSKHLHLVPFKRFHVDPTTGSETRVFDEPFTCDAWINAHDALQKSPAEPNCKLERVIASLMFWSDSTHLANFGTAKVWPIYMYLGNLSKYIRAKPNSGACHHVAYIPSVRISFLLSHTFV